MVTLLIIFINAITKGKMLDLWEILTTFTVYIYLCIKLNPHYFVT